MSTANGSDSLAPSWILKKFPESFQTKVTECKVGGDSNPGQFWCTLRVNINTESEWQEWFRQFKASSGTTWIVRTRKSTSKSPAAKFSFAKDYVCHHSSLRKTDTSKKSTNCTASLTVRLKKSNRYIRRRDPYVKDGLCAVVAINHYHNHGTNNDPEALNWLQRSDETKNKFLGYFNSGMSVACAKTFHESLLMAEGAELANASINPPGHWIYQFHEKWRQEKLSGCGLRWEPENITLQNKIKSLEEEGCAVYFQESPLCIVLMTPLMKRMLVHQLASKSSFLFADTSLSCDCSLTLALANCKAGAIPVAVAIHNGQSEENVVTVVSQIKKMWTQISNEPIQIENFTTDESSALQQALKTVWPDVPQRLCNFYVSQALWRWLGEAKNGVCKSDRQDLMTIFHGIMAAENAADHEYAVKILFHIDVARKYDSFKSHIQSLLERKHEWCRAFRLHAQNTGENTHNYSEMTFRILKEIVVTRLKSFNSLELFVCSFLPSCAIYCC